MFERYTEEARRALFFARYDASRLGSITIEVDHLLLGLIHEGKGITGKLFARARVPLEDIRNAVEAHAKSRGPVATSVEIPFAEGTKRVLQRAAEEADRLLQQHIGGEHLLLAILREEGSPTAAILMQHGMRINAVRDDIVQLLNEPPAATLQEEPGLGFPEATGGLVSGSSSSLEVRIAPSAGTGSTSTGRPGSWTSASDLRTLLSRICHCPMARIELPSWLDKGERYEFSIRYSPDQREETRNRLLLAWVEAHFRITVTREARPMDVYVLTAPQGLNPAVKPLGDERFGASFGSVGVSVERGPGAPPPPESLSPFMKGGFPGAIGDVSVAGATLGVFAELLEMALDRFVLDETGLEGRYDLQVRGEGASADEFRGRLRDQLGLVLTPASREVTMLVVRSAEDTRASG